MLLPALNLLLRFPKPSRSALIVPRPGKSASDYGTDPGVSRRLGGLMDVHLHIIEAGGAGAEHLHDAEHRAPVSVFRNHPVLPGHDPLKQPFVKGHVVGGIAE